VGLHPPRPLRRGISTTLPGAAVRHHPLLARPPRQTALWAQTHVEHQPTHEPPGSHGPRRDTRQASPPGPPASRIQPAGAEIRSIA
jgi:hypothetical protein